MPSFGLRRDGIRSPAAGSSTSVLPPGVCFVQWQSRCQAGRGLKKSCEVHGDSGHPRLNASLRGRVGLEQIRTPAGPGRTGPDGRGLRLLTASCQETPPLTTQSKRRPGILFAGEETKSTKRVALEFGGHRRLGGIRPWQRSKTSWRGRERG